MIITHLSPLELTWARISLTRYNVMTSPLHGIIMFIFMVAFSSQYGPPFPTNQWECVSTGDQATL